MRMSPNLWAPCKKARKDYLCWQAIRILQNPSSLQGLNDTKPLRMDPGPGTSNVGLPLGHQKSWKAEAQIVH